MKRYFFHLIASLFALCVPEGVIAVDKLRVVTTLSSYADIAKSIGGGRIEVASIVPPRFNPHFIEPRPSDVLKLKQCDLFIHSGLDLEAWRDPLVNAAGRGELRAGGRAQLDLSAGVSLLEIPRGAVTRADGDIHLFGNPHYWLDPRNGLVFAESIAAKLVQLDPAGESVYISGRDKFTADLNSRIAEWQSAASQFERPQFVGYHNEWVYLMNFLGFDMKMFLEPKPGIPPSPQQLEEVKRFIREKGVRAIVQPSFYPKDAGESVAKDTGTPLLLLAQNAGEIPGTETYAGMLEYNISKIMEALKNG